MTRKRGDREAWSSTYLLLPGLIPALALNRPALGEDEREPQVSDKMLWHIVLYVDIYPGKVLAQVSDCGAKPVRSLCQSIW